MEKQTKRPHVLAVPYPAQGHINPMLQFCKRLTQKGLKTTIAITVHISKTMHAVSGAGSPVAVGIISDGYDEGGYSQADGPESYLSSLQDVGSRTLADLISQLGQAGTPVDALVYDGFIPWALDVAEAFGLLGALFFTQSAAVNSIYYRVYRGLLLLPLSGSKVSMLGLPELEPCETPTFLYDYGSYPGFYQMLTNQFSNIDRTGWVFFNTFYDMEEEELNWMAKNWRVRTIGPTLPSMYLDRRLDDDVDYDINLFKPRASECMSWLNERAPRSVVYVSFGSLVEVEARQMEEVAWGLHAAGIAFLWVVRKSEGEKLPAKFVQDIVESKNEKGLIVTWSPQLEVLFHPSIGCFVTHCGFNSVIEAISLGVPIVAMPQWTDQPTNAKYVEDIWGIGLRTKQNEKGIVGREELVSRIREIMVGEKGKGIRSNTVKWRDLAKRALDKGGSSDKNMDEFVHELKQSR